MILLVLLPTPHYLFAVIRLIVVLFILVVGFFFGFVFGRMGRRREDSDRPS